MLSLIIHVYTTQLFCKHDPTPWDRVEKGGGYAAFFNLVPVVFFFYVVFAFFNVVPAVEG